VRFKRIETATEKAHDAKYDVTAMVLKTDKQMTTGIVWPANCLTAVRAGMTV